MPGNWSGDPNVGGTQRDAHVRSADAGPSVELEPFGDPSPLDGDLVATLLAKPRDARVGVYDSRLAYALAVIAAWSYGTARALEETLQSSGFPGCRVKEAAVTNDALFIVSTAYVVQSACGRLAVVAFRGTEPVNLVSWLTDADVIVRDLPTSWCGAGLVHRGFLANVEPVWQDIQIALRDMPRLEAVYVTGHSLGGAMAVLAAARLHASLRYRDLLEGVYTYGQPAVGDADFAAWAGGAFGARLYRHVYQNDIVPHLPPTTTGDFVHFGTEYRGEGTRTKETWKPSSTVKPLGFALFAVAGALCEFVTRRTQWLKGIRFRNSIDDHGPAFYIATSRNTLLPPS
jgi:hypothetical protein